MVPLCSTVDAKGRHKQPGSSESHNEMRTAEIDGWAQLADGVNFKGGRRNLRSAVSVAGLIMVRVMERLCRSRLLLRGNAANFVTSANEPA